MSATPEAWLKGCIASHRRLERTIQDLTEAVARRESLLPRWSVGHVLTHIARNCDSHTFIVDSAKRGEVVPQYPGGPAQRDGDIAKGAGRPAAELVADIAAANQRLEAAWASVDESFWRTALRQTNAGPNSVAWSVFLRWREVEVHLVDLGLPQITWEQLSPEYLDIEWREMTAGLRARAPEGMALLLQPDDRPSRAYGPGPEVVPIAGSPRRILQWLMGRGGEPGWPELAPWS